MASEQRSTKRKISAPPSGFPGQDRGQWVMQALTDLNDRIESFDGKIDNKIEKLDGKIDHKIGNLDERLRRIETKITWIIAIGAFVVLDAGVAPGGLIFRVLQALASSG